MVSPCAVIPVTVGATVSGVPPQGALCHHSYVCSLPLQVPYELPVVEQPDHSIVHPALLTGEFDDDISSKSTDNPYYDIDNLAMDEDRPLINEGLPSRNRAALMQSIRQHVSQLMPPASHGQVPPKAIPTDSGAPSPVIHPSMSQSSAHADPLMDSTPSTKTIADPPVDTPPAPVRACTETGVSKAVPNTIDDPGASTAVDDCSSDSPLSHVGQEPPQTQQLFPNTPEAVFKHPSSPVPPPSLVLATRTALMSGIPSSNPVADGTPVPASRLTGSSSTQSPALNSMSTFSSFATPRPEIQNCQGCL